MDRCSYRHCQSEPVAEVSFKGGSFVPVCESHLKAYRSSAQASGLSLREAALGESKFAQSPTEVLDLRERMERLEKRFDALESTVEDDAERIEAIEKRATPPRVIPEVRRDPNATPGP